MIKVKKTSISPQLQTPDVESVGLTVYKKIEYQLTELEFWKYTAGICGLAYLILEIYLLYLYLPRDIRGFYFFDITIYYIHPLICAVTCYNVLACIIAPEYPLSKDAVILFIWVNYAGALYVVLLLIFIAIQFFINTTGGLVYSVLFISGLTIEYLPSLILGIPANYLFNAWLKLLSEREITTESRYVTM